MEQSARLGGELRDAIYSLSQLHAASHCSQAASWAVRGLQSGGTQTEYCRLWVASLCGAPGGGDSESGGASGEGSVLCTVTSSASSEESGAAGGEPAGEPVHRVLSLPVLRQQLRELYRAKAPHDIAVARGQRPFMPLAAFLASHQHGSEGPAVRQRAAQLQASVEAHAAADEEVALFGVSVGWLGERAASDAASPPPAAGVPGAPCMDAAAAVPLVLYHSRRRQGGAAAEQAQVLPPLRRFCAAAWHAAYLQSAGRPPVPGFSAAALLPATLADVHSVAVGMPGVEQLLAWALGGGVGAALPRLDLGLRLSELQAPQLYLLAAEACRLLGLGGAPPLLYVRSSGEAAAYYLLLPADARLHGLNGGAAEPAAEGGSSSSSSVTSSSQDPPQCAVVLTSALVDLLEPAELKAAMAGCLGFHAELTCAAGIGPEPGAVPAEQAAQGRSMAALATLGSLCALGPASADILSQQLPRAMAPLFATRVQPLLLRSLRFLALFTDRVAAAAAGGWRPVAAAAVKQAAGCAALKDELSLEAVLEQARALGSAGHGVLPAALLREDARTVAGAGASLTLLRIRELERWWGTRQ